MKKVLFVSKTNQGTSVMAQFLFNQYCQAHGKNAHADSAGIMKDPAGLKLPPLGEIIEYLARLRLDISSYRSQWIGNMDPNGWDLVVCTYPDDLVTLQALARKTVGNAKVILAHEPDGLSPFNGEPLTRAKNRFLVEGVISQVLEELGLQ